MLAGSTAKDGGTHSAAGSVPGTPRRKPLLPRSLQNASAASTPRPSPLRNVVLVEAGAKHAGKGVGDGLRVDGRQLPRKTAPTNPLCVSPAEASSRATSKLNDDARERSERRKSLAERRRSEGAAGLLCSASQIVVPPSLGGSPRSASSSSGTPRSAPRTPSRRVSVVEPSSAQRQWSSPLRNVLSEQELNERFEGLMKMITNNKVNPQNSWGLDLIDFFTHFSLFREGGSINFQKASCTLDGCAKIYISRVDSLSSETNKLLNGLSSADGSETSKNSSSGDNEGDRDHDDEIEDGERQKTSRGTRRSEKTLAKPESITADKIGTLEFSVDPLFKKTSADFDEGGAGGLLLNHLHMQRDGKIIFGACDALLDCEDEDEVNYPPAATPLDSVDVKYLKSRYASLLDSIFDREICPTFSSFSFGSNAQAFSIGPSAIIGRAGAEQDSSFMDDDDCNPFEEQEDRDRDSFLMATSAARFDTDAGPDEDDEVDFADGNVGPVHPPGSDCRTSAATRMVNSLMAARQNGDIYAYFDLASTKNWAGPENWKIRRIAKTGNTAESSKKARKPAASSQEDMCINFLTGPPVDIEALFARGGPSINMPRPRKAGARCENHLLPDDLRFSSEQLLSMFTREGSLVNKPGHSMEDDVRGDHLETEAENDGGDLGADISTFYSEEDSELAQDGTFAAGSSVQGPSTIEEEVGDGGHGGDSLEMDYGSQSAAAWPVSRQQRPAERIKFDRQAKRVDVRKLKENIWDCMTVRNGTNQEKPQDPAEDAVAAGDPVSPRKADAGGDMTGGEERRFVDVVKSVRAAYPPKLAGDISAAFCFMCLLHLANEKGLHIRSEEGLGQLIVRQEQTV